MARNFKRPNAPVTNVEPVSDTPNSLTEPEMVVLLAKRKQKRLNDCLFAVQKALTDYGCKIDATPTITSDGRIQVEVRIVSND